MKEIKAIIHPDRLNRVLSGLHEIPDLPGFTVSTVLGYGRAERGGIKGAILKSAERSKIEVVVGNTMVNKVVAVLRENARTGNRGDGKIFIIECNDTVSIRTGKRGRGAI